MTVRTEIREQVFAKYVLGHTQEQIAERFNIHRATISRWIKKFEWDKKRQELLQDSKNNAKLSQREQEDKVLDALIFKGFEAIKSDAIKYTARDINETVKLRSLRRGEATENINVSTGKSIEDEFKEFLGITKKNDKKCVKE